MTNFKDKRRAVAIIREVFEKTSEEYLRLRIDEPFEKAVASFEFNRDAPVTHGTFTRIIADFIRHVHVQALWGKQELTVMQARDEAVAILQEGYPGPTDERYEAALLNALNPELGLEYVLGQMAAHIIAVVRAKHVRWVLASRLELTDWPTRCLIAEILFECWKPFLPENFNGRDAADFAHCLSELVTSEISASKTVNKMFGASVEPL